MNKVMHGWNGLRLVGLSQKPNRYPADNDPTGPMKDCRLTKGYKAEIFITKLKHSPR